MSYISPKSLANQVFFATFGHEKATFYPYSDAFTGTFLLASGKQTVIKT